MKKSIIALFLGVMWALNAHATIIESFENVPAGATFADRMNAIGGVFVAVTDNGNSDIVNSFAGPNGPISPTDGKSFALLSNVDSVDLSFDIPVLTGDTLLLDFQDLFPRVSTDVVNLFQSFSDQVDILVTLGNANLCSLTRTTADGSSADWETFSCSITGDGTANLDITMSRTGGNGDDPSAWFALDAIRRDKGRTLDNPPTTALLFLGISVMFWTRRKKVLVGSP